MRYLFVFVELLALGGTVVGIMDTIKNLRAQLQEKLEIAKTLAEAAKAGGAAAREEAKKALAAVQDEIADLRQQILDLLLDNGVNEGLSTPLAVAN